MEPNTNQDIQPQMQQPYTQQTSAPVEDTMTVGAWLGTIILACIPFVSIIMLIVWATSNDPSKKSRKNWAIAQFIVMAIVIVISLILVFLLGASIIALSGINNY